MPGALYPIALDLGGRTVLVVGLGAVGRRKAAGVAEAGGKVVGIDPDREASALASAALGDRIEVRAVPYDPGQLAGMSLAFAASTAAVNRRVVADAKRAGIWVCSATDPDEGDFTVPAVWRDGPLMLAVATSGASPALASTLRDRAAEALGPSASGLASLLAELRPLVLARVGDPEARRRLLADWAHPRWLDRWRADGPESVRRALSLALDDAMSGGHADPGRTCQNPGLPR